jgi:hypothetical protein
MNKTNRQEYDVRTYDGIQDFARDHFLSAQLELWALDNRMYIHPDRITSEDIARFRLLQKFTDETGRIVKGFLRHVR